MLAKERLIILKKIYPYLSTYKKNISLFLILKTYFLALTLALPIIYKVLINDVIINGETTILKYVLLSYILIYLLETIGKFLYQRINNQFTFSVLNNIKSKMLDTILTSDNKISLKYVPSDLVERVQNDVEEINNFLFNDIIDYAFNFLSLFIISGILLYNSPILAAVCLVSLPLSYFISKIMGRKVWDISKLYRERFALYNNFLQNNISNWKEIKMYNLYKENENALKNNWDDISVIYTKKQILVYLNKAILRFKELYIIKVNLYFIGGLLVLENHLKIAVLFVFMKYFENFYSSIEFITNSMIKFKEKKPLIDKVLEILETDSYTLDYNNYSRNCSIKMNNISFSYPGFDKTILNNISIEINQGDKIGILGKSGCGKTTLIKLLMGYYGVSNGEVLFDNKASDKIKYYIANNISVITQDSILFNLSVIENFKLIKEDITLDEIKDLCNKTCIKEMIEALPKDYLTIIGDGGNILSGGQKQCLAVARLLMSQKPIIILDEFTSAMDKQIESSVLKIMKEYVKDKTLIMISHNKEILKLCTKFYIINNGKIEDYTPIGDL